MVVLQLCCLTVLPLQAEELVQMSAYQEGRLADALVDVYLHLDEKMASEACRSELEKLASNKDPRGGGRY